MQVYVPTVSATFEHAGRRYRLIRGRTTIQEGHPLLKGREHLMQPLKIDFPAPAKPKAEKPKAEKVKEGGDGE